MRTMNRSTPRRATPPRAGLALACWRRRRCFAPATPRGGRAAPISSSARPPQARLTSQPLPPPAGEPSELIGQGPIKIALIVPLTQASGPSSVGASLRNAAQLAYLEVRTKRREHRRQGRSLLARRRGGRRAGRRERRRGADHRPGLRRRGQRGGTRRERRRQARDRLFDRLLRGLARRLSPVLPRRGKCRADHRLRRATRQEVRGGAGSRQRIWRARARAVPAKRRQPRRARRLDRKIQARPARRRGQADCGGLGPDRYALHSRIRRKRWAPWRASSRPPISTPSVCRSWAEPVERSARAEAPGAAGRVVCGPGEYGLQRLRRQISRQVRFRAVAHRDPRLRRCDAGHRALPPAGLAALRRSPRSPIRQDSTEPTACSGSAPRV